MIEFPYDHGFGEVWRDILIERREGFYTSVSDFHQHEFFEINLILSGDVKILFSNRVVEAKGGYLVLTRPYTKHFITCSPNKLYKRLYLCFSSSFLLSTFSEYEEILSVFGKNGSIIPLNKNQVAFCENVIKQIESEENVFCKKTLTAYLLSHIRQMDKASSKKTKNVPKYIITALSHIEKNYHKKIVAQELADFLFVSRTTLMTNFKKYTGCTLNQYITNLRLKRAIELLSIGKTEQETAEACGFSDSGALIRTFKSVFKTTPKKFFTNKKRL